MNFSLRKSKSLQDVSLANFESFHNDDKLNKSIKKLSDNLPATLTTLKQNLIMKMII